MRVDALLNTEILRRLYGHLSRKRWISRKANFLVRFLFISLILFAPFPATAESEKTKANQDIVFLLDTSSSMDNIFKDVKKAILEYALKAQPGDMIILISFGEKVELDVRQKISSSADIKRIERELELLEPDENFTYMTGALDKGMEELDLLGKRNPGHLRTMVLLSDGKNNPPPNVADPIRFEDLLQRYPGLLQGENSAFFYLSLGDNPDTEVVKWMEAAKGTAVDLGKELAELAEEKHQLGFAQVFVEPVSIDLGTVEGPNAIVPVSLAFFPSRGNASGQGISLIFKGSYQENPSWKTLLEITPASISCSNKPWTTTFSVQVDSFQEGLIVGTIEIKPLPGDVLFIDPPEIPVTLTTRQPKVTVELRERLKFGPIYPGKVYRETKSIMLIPDPPAEPSDIRVSPSMGLPADISLHTNIQKKDTNLELLLTVESAENFRTSHSQLFEGIIQLAGVQRNIKFTRDHLEVAVEVAPPPGQSRLLNSIWSRLDMNMVLTVGAAAAAMIFCFILYRLVKARPTSALEGKLILVNLKDKSFNPSRLITANLHTLGKSFGRDSITIGSAKEAGLTIPHKSVAPYHCEISAELTKGNKRIYVQPVGENPVIVNLQKINEPVPLSDRDLIEIGAYTFRFENPHPYKQLVVKYIDERILKGTPTTWDIDSDGFNLLPRDALPGSNEEIYISFADLKAVYFVRDFDGQIGKKIVSPATQIRGLHMLLKFSDKENVEGYTSESYSPASPRFYFFPADQSGNTISLLVERRHLEKVELLDAKEQEASHPGAITVSLNSTHKSA
jgi:hypothetical protein